MYEWDESWIHFIILPCPHKQTVSPAPFQSYHNGNISCKANKHERLKFIHLFSAQYWWAQSVSAMDEKVNSKKEEVESMPRQTVNSFLMSIMSIRGLKRTSSSRKLWVLNAKSISFYFHPPRKQSLSFLIFCRLRCCCLWHNGVQGSVGNSFSWKLSLWATVNGSRGFQWGSVSLQIPPVSKLSGLFLWHERRKLVGET